MRYAQNMKKVNYTLPSGFIEFLPGEKRTEQMLLDRICRVFERYGFTPIETPAVERMEVLHAKGNEGDNIVYGISPILPPSRQAERDAATAGSGSSDSKDVDANTEARGLKFDLTVPLAAYIARHLNDLTFPFARYQTDMVFRGERAKLGRYRQFRQCDVDVVGRGSLSLLYDAQMIAMIVELFETLEIQPILVRVNNRKVLTGLFESMGVAEDRIATCVAVLDAVEKVGVDNTRFGLVEEGLTEDQANEVLAITSKRGDDALAALEACEGMSDQFNTGVQELTTVIDAVRQFGVSDDSWVLDLAIARGLNYYTGTVYETTLVGHESLGSVCSGGRYEELVGMFVGSEKMPGVGLSIGLTRLLGPLLKRELIKPEAPTPAQIAILNLDESLMPLYLELSQTLRRAGWNVETSFSSQKLKKQMQRVNRREIPFAILIGKEEASEGVCQVRDMGTGDQASVKQADLVAWFEEKR